MKIRDSKYKIRKKTGGIPSLKRFFTRNRVSIEPPPGSEIQTQSLLSRLRRRTHRVAPNETSQKPKRNITQKILHPIIKGRIFFGKNDFVGKNLSKINFSGYTLTNTDFTNANLKEADFTNAELKIVNFKNADLTGAIFTGAKIDRVYLDGAILTGAIFDKSLLELSGSNKKGIKLNGHDLTGVNFEYAYLEKADLTGTILTGAKTDNRTILTGAILTGATFDSSFLQNANRDMSNIKLNGLDLTGFKLNEKLFIGADFTGAILHDANFSRSDIDKSIFIGAKLSRARFPGTRNLSHILNQADKDMNGIMIQSTRISDVVLNGIDFTGADLSHVTFYNTVLTDCILTNAKLYSIGLERATLNNLTFSEGMFSRLKNDMSYSKLISMDLTNEDFTGKHLYRTEFNNVRLGKKMYYLSGVIFKDILSYDPVMFKNAENDMTGISLDGIDLTGVDFSGKNLEGAIFTNTVLTDTKFNQAKLKNVKFIGENGKDNQFIQQLLAAVNDMKYIIFSGLHFTNVDFADKDLRFANFNNTTLNNVSFSKTTNLTHCKFVDAKLHNVRFEIPHLHNVNFSHAKISSTDPMGPFIGKRTGTAVSEESGYRMHIEDTNFTEADLYKANFSHLIMDNINMTKANLIESKFTNSVITDCNFTEADLIDANLSYSNLRNTNFTYADLTRATCIVYENLRRNGLMDNDNNVSGAICNGIVGTSSVFRPCSTTQGILDQKLPEKWVVNKDEALIQNAVLRVRNQSSEIHLLSSFVTIKMNDYIQTMKSILGKNTKYNDKQIIDSFVNAIDSINEKDLTMIEIIPNNRDGLVNLEDRQLQSGKIKRIMSNKGIHVGYQIPNTKIGLKNRVRHVLNKILSMSDREMSDRDKTYFGVTGEFIKQLPNELSNFKTLFLSSFINDTFFSYGDMPMVDGVVDFDAAVDTRRNRCQSCVKGIREQLMRNLITTIEISCKGNTCGNDIKQIADVLDIQLENQRERDKIQDEDMNPIFAKWVESIEKDKNIGPGVALSPEIKEARALSCLKFMKTHLRKHKINYLAELIGYNASIDIKNYMIKYKDFLNNAQLGGKRRHKRTRKIHRK